MNPEVKTSKPSCTIGCELDDPLYGAERRENCPGKLQTLVAAPTPASDSVGCLVEVCRNPSELGNEPVFSESYDDGADTLTLHAQELPTVEKIHELIEKHYGR